MQLWTPCAQTLNNRCYIHEAKHLDKSKVRIRRDNNKLISSIKTLAILNQYKRKILNIDNVEYLIADVEDYLNALKYCEYGITQTYYQLDTAQVELLNIVKNLYSNIKWIDDPTAILGIHTEEIIRNAQEKLRKKKTWISERLEILVNYGYLYRTFLRPEKGAHGNYYKPSIGDINSILITKPDLDNLRRKTDTWKKEILSKNLKYKINICPVVEQKS